MQSTYSCAVLDRFCWQWRDYQITYTVQGEGLPLLLLHGFGASIGHWRKNIPELAQRHRVYALDLLGFGASDKPNIVYSMELWQAMVQDFWAAHIGVPTVFIGNSIGALLTLMLVSKLPQISRGGVLLNPASGLNHRPEELHFPLRQIMSLFTNLVSSPTTGGWIFDWVRQKNRIRETLKQVYCDRSAITEELVDILHQPSLATGAREVFAQILTAPPGPRPEELLSGLAHPLLVLWGAADPWTPIKGAALYQNFAQHLDIEVIPMANTGHCPHDEQPEIVNKLLLNWLQRFSAENQPIGLC